MRVSTLTLLISSLSLTHASSLKARNLYAGGGWGLIVSDPNACPAGTTGHSDLDVFVCCPTNYESPDSSGVGSRICCQPGTQCLESFQATPFCADSSWILWNQTQGVADSYFCCLPGQTGVQTSSSLGCSGPNVEVASSALAVLLGQPTPTGNAAAFITGVVSSTGTSTIITGTSSTGGGLLGTIVGIVTHHSDSRRVEPRPFSIPLTGIVGCGVAALSFVGGFFLMFGA